MKKKLGSLIVLGLLALVASPAKAGFVPVFLGTSPNGILTNYNYTLNFTTNIPPTETLNAGDFVTIYDIGPATIVAPGLSVSQTLLGTTAPGTLPTDSSTLLNVTFTYNGPALLTDTTFLGIVVTSAFAPRTTQYTSMDTIPLGKNGQIGPVTGPNPNVIPEPASVVLLGLGGLGVLALRLRKLGV